MHWISQQIHLRVSVTVHVRDNGKNMRHLEEVELWIQQVLWQACAKIQKVTDAQNPADQVTMYLTRNEITRQVCRRMDSDWLMIKGRLVGVKGADVL